MNNNNNNNSLDMLMAMFQTIDLVLNISQTSNDEIAQKLEHQDNDYLEKIIEQNEEIIQQNKDILEKLK